jgi:peroxiredoxin
MSARKIEVGGKFPLFELPDEKRTPWNLSGQLRLGPAMLVFYRGDW